MGVDLSPPHTNPSYDAFDDGSDSYSPRMEELVRAQLIEVGEDPEREGLVRNAPACSESHSTS